MHHAIRHFKEPRTVFVKVDFIKLGEIDTMNENYNAEIIIESKWIETEEIINYNSEIHWNPKFSIENALQIQNEKIKYETKNDESIFSYKMATFFFSFEFLYQNKM